MLVGLVRRAGRWLAKTRWVRGLWFRLLGPLKVEIEASDSWTGSGCSVLLRAIHRGKPVGQVMLLERWLSGLKAEGWWVSSLFVEHMARGRRVGERLMEAAVRLAKEKGTGQVWLSVSEENAPAISLYAKLGFRRSKDKEVEERVNAYYAAISPGSPRMLVLHKHLREGEDDRA